MDQVVDQGLELPVLPVAAEIRQVEGVGAHAPVLAAGFQPVRMRPRIGLEEAPPSLRREMADVEDDVEWLAGIGTG